MELCKLEEYVDTESEIIREVYEEELGTNPESIMLSDYCDNRFNKGIQFNQYLFQYITKSKYKYIGERYLYTGLIFHKPKGMKSEMIVGEWGNCIKKLYEADEQKFIGNDDVNFISVEQIAHLFEEYNQILRMN